MGLSSMKNIVIPWKVARLWIRIYILNNCYDTYIIVNLIIIKYLHSMHCYISDVIIYIVDLYYFHSGAVKALFLTTWNAEPTAGW